MTEHSASRPRPSRFRPSSSSDLEDHRFEPVRVLQWRNRDLVLCFADGTAWRARRAAADQALTRAQASFDVEALELIARDDEIVALASTPETVELLWEVCQVPDYRNISGRRACQPGGPRLPLSDQQRPRASPKTGSPGSSAYCDRTEGDIDTLANRIAHIRTWTFIANRDWLADPLHWQLRAREHRGSSL